MFDIVYRYDPKQRRNSPPPADAKEARHRLEEGNHYFAALATGAVAPTHIVEMGQSVVGPDGVPVQQPFAVVLGCSDARVPPEMIFDCACNELFVVRVAGSVMSQEQLESVDYAVKHLGQSLKLLVVLGHSQCGAVTAAVDAFLEPAQYLELATSHHLRSIVNILFPSVRGAMRSLARRWGEDVSKLPGYRAALIECTALINAALTASILKSEFGDPASARRIVFGVYDLATYRVHVSLPPEDEHEPAIRLMEAPTGREDFRQFAFQLASSAFITRLLHGKQGGEARYFTAP